MVHALLCLDLMPCPALLISLLLASSGRPAVPPPAPSLRDGDLVFQTSRSGQGAAVALATGSRLTHMGVVLVEGGVPWVLEAVEPVRRTRLAEWRRRGADGRLWARRLQDADAVLTPAALQRMRRLGRSWIGRHYDLRFRWDDERLYCSGLAYKLYDRAAGVRLGRLQRAGDLALEAPEVRRLLAARFGPRGLDPDEPVITPQAIFEDPRLVEIPVP